MDLESPLGKQGEGPGLHQELRALVLGGGAVLGAGQSSRGTGWPAPIAITLPAKDLQKHILGPRRSPSHRGFHSQRSQLGGSRAGPHPLQPRPAPCAPGRTLPPPRRLRHSPRHSPIYRTPGTRCFPRSSPRCPRRPAGVRVGKTREAALRPLQGAGARFPPDPGHRPEPRADPRLGRLVPRSTPPTRGPTPAFLRPSFSPALADAILQAHRPPPPPQPAPARLCQGREGACPTLTAGALPLCVWYRPLSL